MRMPSSSPESSSFTGDRNRRTRIKMCGFTRRTDIDQALDLGVDALGLVFYPASPRYIEPRAAARLVRHLPPFATVVGLFVNAQPEEIRAVREQVALDLLQFHGDEAEPDCLGHGLPFIKAARVQPGLDLVEFALRFPHARGLLLDAYVEGYGGGGKVFDWSLIPAEISARAILSGGLEPANATEAIRQVRPWAVDVSSGIEQAKGIKDAEKMRRFVEAVRAADLDSPP